MSGLGWTVVSSTCSSAGGYNWNAVTQVAFVMMLIIFVLLVVVLALSCVPSWQPLPLHGHSLRAQHCFSVVLSPRGLHAHVIVQFLVLAGMIFALAYDSWALSLVDTAGTELIAGLVRLRLNGTKLPILDCLARTLELPQKLQCMSIKAGSGLTLACGLAACIVALLILVLSVQALRESDPFTPLIWRLSCIQAVSCGGSTLFFSIPSLLTLQSVVHCGFQLWISWYACAASTVVALYLVLFYRRAVLDFPAKSPLRCMQVQSIKHPAPPQELPSKALKRASSTQLETTNDLRRLNGLEPLYPGQTEETEMDRWETQQAIAEEDRLAAALGPRPQLLPTSSFASSSVPSFSSSRSVSYSLRSPHMPPPPPPVVRAPYSPYSPTPSVPAVAAASLYQISEDAAQSGGPVGWPSVANGYAPSASASAVDTQMQLQSQYQGALHNDDDASSYYAHHIALTQAARMIDGSGSSGVAGSPLALDHLQLGPSMPHASRPTLALSPTPTSSARRLAPVQSTRQATLLAQFRTSSNSPRPF